ncbi:universal stress protein [Nocardioides sp. AX2bis]|uniref:universal stress protein n=1 Tax=Nocardioides sp. AX2bis TaxID=2653157 RepID=UPI0012F1268E|nr:universal stress protein [Nocardioides sp. AX2bis]VXB37362.1 Universal stress protein MSMEG_4207 [Nocardioides sp. AX2bis]
MGTVVVGYVPNPEGDAALDRAISEARLRESDLLVVDVRRRVGDEGADLAPARERLAASGVSFDVREGPGGVDGAEDLVEVASADDLIVIGLKRRSPLGKLILGSSAQRILLDAPCPVLTVKP